MKTKLWHSDEQVVMRARVGEVDVEPGLTVEALGWHDERIWLRVRSLGESDELGPYAVGTRYAKQGSLAVEDFLGFGALPLSRLVQPRAAREQRARERRQQGERGRCGWHDSKGQACGAIYAGTRDAAAVEAAGGGAEGARPDGKVQLCRRHRAATDEGSGQ